MAKKSVFNFGQSPAAKEIGSAMQSVEESPTVPTTQFTRRNKTGNTDWTLAQCRLPNGLHERMREFCYREHISINEFIKVAVQEMLDKV